MGIKMWPSLLQQVVMGAPTIPMPNKGWESGDAGGWTFTGSTGIPAVTTDNPRSGSYDLHFNTASSSVRTGVATWTLPAALLAAIKGRTVKFTVYRRCALVFSGGVGSYQRIGLNWGTGTGYTTIPFTPYSVYDQVLVQQLIPAAATKLDFIIEWYKAGGGSIYHLDIDDMDAVAS
mgnify:CR=1 FL=1